MLVFSCNQWEHIPLFKLFPKTIVKQGIVKFLDKQPKKDGMLVVHDFSKTGGIPSGPEAFLMSRVKTYASTPSLLIKLFSISWTIARSSSKIGSEPVSLLLYTEESK